MIEFGKTDSLAKSFRYAIRGLSLGWKLEKNIRFQVIVLLLAIMAGWYFQITHDEWLVVFVVGGLVIGFEFMNSALEYIEDVLHPTFHKAIGHSKDLAAAAVLVAGIIAVIAGGVIFLPHLLKLVA